MILHINRRSVLIKLKLGEEIVSVIVLRRSKNRAFRMM